MQRASEIRRVGAWNAEAAVDCVVLDSDERRRRRGTLTGEAGTRFLLDLPRATVLRDGDGLVLESGAIVRIAGRPEPLLEIEAATPHQLARIAWHLGNRHADIDIAGGCLRIRRDHVLREMLIGLGATVRETQAPFEPEQGAYGGHGHGHDDGGHNHGS